MTRAHGRKTRRVMTQPDNKRGPQEPQEDRRIGLYNMPDGTHGRGTGVYMDHEQRVAAERRRAQLEGREPDLETPPATVGTALEVEAFLPGPTTQATVPVALQPGYADPLAVVEVPEDEAATVDVSLANQYAAEGTVAAAEEAIASPDVETTGESNNLDGGAALSGDVEAGNPESNEDATAEGATDPNNPYLS